MKIVKESILFCVGGSSYYVLELLWRGRSHITMFVLGGLCFLLMGHLGQAEPKLWLPWRMVLGAVICISGELLFGLLFNRGYEIWDYRQLPLNWGGQICLLYTLLWLLLSVVAMWLYDRCEITLERFLLKL